MTNESLLTFPCDFTIKVFGLANEEYEAAVATILKQHAAHTKEPVIENTTSSNGKYKALSITVYVRSKEELDQLYQALTACPQVLMAL